MNYRVNGIRFSQDGQDTDVEVNQGGVDCIYKRKMVPFSKPVRYVRMDLDGTSVKSEEFWIRRIQETIGKVSHHPDFTLSEDDLPYVSGFTTAEHLSYCLEKYKIPVSRNDALKVYHALTKERLERIRSGKEKTDAFQPREGLKEFLFCLKNKEIQIGLATSGLDYKAIGEIESAFSLLGLGKPTDFYDAIITGGKQKEKGSYGTLGERASKPHPWIYAELAFGLSIQDKSQAIVIEDSSAGVISARTAGFNAIEFKDGNLYASGLDKECLFRADTFEDMGRFLGLRK